MSVRRGRMQRAYVDLPPEVMEEVARRAVEAERRDGVRIAAAAILRRLVVAGLRATAEEDG